MIGQFIVLCQVGDDWKKSLVFSPESEWVLSIFSFGDVNPRANYDTMCTWDPLRTRY